MNPLIETFKRDLESFDLFWGIAPQGTLKYEKGKAVKSHYLQSTLNLITKMIEELEGRKRDKQMTDDAFCVWCNGHIKNNHHQMTCGNYDLALSDTIPQLVEFREWLGGEIEK